MGSVEDDSHARTVVDLVFGVVLLLCAVCVLISADRQADVFFSFCVVWAFAAAGGALWISRQRRQATVDQAKAAASVAKNPVKAAAATAKQAQPAAPASKKGKKPQQKAAPPTAAATPAANGKVSFDDAKMKRDLDKELADWTGKLANVTADRDATLAELERVERKHAEAKARLLHEKATMEDRIRSTKAEVAQLKVEVGSVSQEQNALQRHLKDESRIADEELQQITQAAADAQVKWKEAEEACKEEERKSKQAQKQADVIVRRHREVEKSLERILEEVDSFSETISMLEDENSQLREELQALLSDECSVDDFIEEWHSRRRGKKGGAKGSNGKGDKGGKSRSGKKGASKGKNGSGGDAGKRRTAEEQQ